MWLNSEPGVRMSKTAGVFWGVLLLVVAAAASPVSAEIRNLESAIEAARITMTKQGAGRFEVEAQACPTCKKRRFDVSDDTQFINRGQQSSIDQFLATQPTTGTVIYKSDSGELTKVLWSK